MFCQLSLGLALMLLFIGCLAIPSHERDERDSYLAAFWSSRSVSASSAEDEVMIDNVEALLNPQYRETNVDYLAEKIDLQAQIANLTSLSQQLHLGLESAFQILSQMNPTTSNIQKPPSRVSENKFCGAEHECVEIRRCKSENVNQHGNYVISFRNSVNTCGFLKTCCHKSNTILSPKNDIFDEDDTSDDDVIPGCGTRNIDGVNVTLESAPNQEAQFGEFPWVVAIMIRKEVSLEYIGGGSILAPTVVMTAAHKVDNISVNQLVVRAGEWDMKTELEQYPHVNRNVSEIRIHDEYSRGTRTNNIALLILSISFSTITHISPICLPSVEQNFDYSRCIVTGWGKRTFDSTEYHNILKAITVPVVPRSECLTKLPKITDITSRLDMSYICAGGEKGIDSCYGDGGAPLVCPILGYPNRFVQAGIVAFSISCGLENIPAAYTNVAHLMPWVSKQLDRLAIDKKYYTL